MIVELFQKNPSGGFRAYFLKSTPESLRFVILPLEIKFCYTPRKFQSQKPKLIKIQHDFFLITPKNPTFTLKNSGRNKALILLIL